MRDDDRLVWLGWMLRDYYNAARAACSGPAEENDPAVRLRRIALISRAADECLKVLDLMEPLFPDG